MIEVPKILYFLQYKEKMLHVPLQFIIIIRVFLSKKYDHVMYTAVYKIEQKVQRNSLSTLILMVFPKIK